jgi:aminoglycoside phosphotransferase (APT) family kinase protein
MHDDEVDVDDDLVRELVDDQFPELSGEPLSRVEAWGTDHAIFRLGDRLSVRLPKIGWAAEQGAKEARWLPVLEPVLPAEVPVPVALGQPADGYPFVWYLAPWIEGDNPAPDGPTDLCQLAVDLAEVVRALQRIDTTQGPAPRTSQRGGPLVDADRSTRARAEQLRGETDVDGLLAVWEAGVHAPAWERPPVWVHGDLSDGNLVTRDGRLAGIIDWGGLLVGDPAVELMCAWNLFDGESRAVYLDALGFVDHATWLRGRAWAVSAALQALPYYRDTNPDIVTRSWRAVHAALDDLASAR